VLQTTWTPYMLSVKRKLSESGKQLGGYPVISPVFTRAVLPLSPA